MRNQLAAGKGIMTGEGKRKQPRYSLPRKHHKKTTPTPQKASKRLDPAPSDDGPKHGSKSSGSE